MTTNTTTARPLVDVAQALLDADDLANNAARVARGEGYVPRTAAELAEAAQVLAEAEAEAEALRAELEAGVAAYTAELLELDDDELGDVVDAIEESTGELIAEARNETALYGDAWAGSAAQLIAARAHARAARAAAAVRWPAPPALPLFEQPVDDDGEPF